VKRLVPSAEYHSDALGSQFHDTHRAGGEVPGGSRHRPVMVWSCNCATCQINRSNGSLRQGPARQHPDDPSWVGLYWVARPGSSRRAIAPGDVP